MMLVVGRFPTKTMPNIPASANPRQTFFRDETAVLCNRNSSDITFLLFHYQEIIHQPLVIPGTDYLLSIFVLLSMNSSNYLLSLINN